MGNTPSDDRQSQLETLRPNHRAMARAILAGATPGDLATRWGMSGPHISKIINSPLFKAELARLEEHLEDLTVDQVREELEGLRPRAVEVIAEELHTLAPSKRRTKCAFDLLDRTDFYPRKPKEEGEGSRTNILIFSPFPGEDPQEAKERLSSIRKEATKRISQDAVDAEFEEVFEGEPND